VELGGWCWVYIDLECVFVSADVNPCLVVKCFAHYYTQHWVRTGLRGRTLIPSAWAVPIVVRYAEVSASGNEELKHTLATVLGS
jgi:hypothetical protein